jgi:coenzyme F420-reducing hydrogenase beta subunit
MVEDRDGFIYPNKDTDICTTCGLCVKVCPIDKPISREKPLTTFAAVHKDLELLKNSSSGGVFAALCSLVFENKGVVFGCTMNDKLEPEHVSINCKSDMKKIQGSKYVQSNVKNTFAETKKYLQEGRQVLFTGTPCQIAGLKYYLGMDYENLITADLICHGVPSPTFFRGYINWLEKSRNAEVIEFIFRDKSKAGMGCIGKATYFKNKELFYEEAIISTLHYYYYYFLEGDIYRECCYDCKYASSGRMGDFTMGDYWGIEKAHPEINTGLGVSVLLVNNDKGMELVDKLNLNLTKSTFEKASAYNGNLLHPTPKRDKREAILKTFRDGGFQAVNEQYRKDLGNKYLLHKVKAMIPVTIKKKAKKILVW